MVVCLDQCTSMACNLIRCNSQCLIRCNSQCLIRCNSQCLIRCNSQCLIRCNSQCLMRCNSQCLIRCNSQCLIRCNSQCLIRCNSQCFKINLLLFQGEGLGLLLRFSAAVNHMDVNLSQTTLVAASSDFSIKLADTETMQQVAVLSGHVGPVLSVKFGPKGKYLVRALCYTRIVNLLILFCCHTIDHGAATCMCAL